MKFINKNNSEPASLTEYRASQFSSFNEMNKDDVRTSLLNEQGHICCYCMKRIPETSKTPSSKIEHFKCRDNFQDEELNYNNMLLSCSGNQGLPELLQTCDTFKGNKDLSFNPASRDRNIEQLIKYKANGEIYSSDNTLNDELEAVLNLNVKILKNNRRVLYEEVQNRIRIEGKKQDGKALKKRFLEKEKEKLLTLKSGKFREYCMVGIHVIDKKLKKL